jgi:hypothetical protein
MSFSSDSTAQRRAEGLILEAVAQEVGVSLHPQRLQLVSGAVVDVDGVAADESVLVEIFAHQGQLKGGQRHKIAGDALKLITIARERTPPPVLILAFGDPDILDSLVAKAGSRPPSMFGASKSSWQNSTSLRGTRSESHKLAR